MPDKPRLDESNIEVLAGDLPKGFWSFDGRSMKEISAASADPAGSRAAPAGKENAGESNRVSAPDRQHNGVQLEQNIKDLKVRLKRKVNKLDSFSDVPFSYIVGMINGQLLGPFGGIATSIVHSAAGSSEFICVGCELKDGRKFIAWMHDEIFKRWESLHKEANPEVAPEPVQSGAA